MKKWRSSIQVKVSLIIGVVTTVLFSGLACHDFITMKAKLNLTLLTLSENTANRMSNNMVSALWDINEDSAEEIIRSEMIEKSIYAIVVRDKRSRIFQSCKRDNKWNLVRNKDDIEGNFIVKRKDIIKNDRKLGSAEFFFTPAFMRKELRDNMIRIILNAVLLDIILFTVLYLTIKIYLIRPVTEITTGLDKSVEQIVSASGRISSASQSLAQGTFQQAAGSEETSSALENTSSMTKQNADNASQTNHLMKEISCIVGKANEAMKQLITAISEISEASEETFKIIKNIDQIAFQTNLLALNASVEAARAGEAGSGFAVVAGEVKNLAKRVKEEAKDTSDLIESTVMKVHEGSKIAETTHLTFSQAIESIVKAGNLINDITAASDEQFRMIQQVSKSSEKIENVIRQNAVSAEDLASSAELMDSQAEVLKESAQKLMFLIKGTWRQGELATA
ncbi:methyl-accepting chemotaxis protein [Desulfobacterales bacterium HSG2]|nr:methyl-accepting chemotaxis protein [Desulfobacterales bacterium HSG2]